MPVVLTLASCVQAKHHLLLKLTVFHPWVKTIYWESTYFQWSWELRQLMVEDFLRPLEICVFQWLQPTG